MRKRKKGKEGNISESVVICSIISNSFIWYNQYLKEVVESEENIWRNSGWKFSKFDENYHLADSKISANQKDNKNEETATRRHIVIKVLKPVIRRKS